MKTLLTKCLAAVKGWFASPVPAKRELLIRGADGEVYPVSEYLKRLQDVTETRRENQQLILDNKALSERIKGATENESKIGRAHV